MFNTIKSNYLFITLIICIFIFAWILQTQYLINWDVSWDLLITDRLLAGGTYTNNYFDLNPPLILYLYTPALFLRELFSLSVTTAFRIYIFFLSFLSFVLCYRYIRTFFLPAQVILFSAVLLIVFLILPVNYFGERDHLVLIFTLPYFLASIYQLQNNKPLTPFYALFIGVFSFLGFAIKPHFLLPLALIEIYRMFHTRHFFSWVRIETATLAVLMLGYLFFVFHFHADFITNVLPLAVRFYYVGFRDSLSDVILQPAACFCYFTLICYCVLFRKSHYSLLRNMFCLVMLGFLASYLLQQTEWFYHILPAYSIALLLITVSFILISDTLSRQTWLMLTVGSALVAFPVIYFYFMFLNAIIYKANREPLINFLQKNATHQPVYFISANPNEIFPAVNYSEAIYASRFMHLFWMPGIAKNAAYHPAITLASDYIRDENRMLKMMIEDINLNKPKYIFVDVKDEKPFFTFVSFQYLPYFSKHPEFIAAWKPYHYLTTLEKRNNPADFSDWHLYWLENLEKLNLDAIDGLAVILTGEGPTKTAYFVKKHQFYKSNAIITIPVSLDKAELELFKHPGMITQTNANAGVMSSILNKALLFPAYRFQIYERG